MLDWTGNVLRGLAGSLACQHGEMNIGMRVHGIVCLLNVARYCDREYLGRIGSTYLHGTYYVGSS